jgi:hypothetical protein
MLVTNLPAWPTSPPPREKKKLAPRRFCSKYLRATVRAIVDFPVPAKPLNQKMHLPSCPSVQLYISWRRSTRVSGKQVGSCCRLFELKGDSAAYGKRLSKSSKYQSLVSQCIVAPLGPHKSTLTTESTDFLSKSTDGVLFAFSVNER